MRVWFPSESDILALHDDLIRTSGGEPGILMRGAVRSAIERATWGPFGGESDLAGRAAMLLRGIATDHPFTDGNKRTAFIVAETFLGRNGLRMQASREDVVAFMLAAARGDVDVRGIAAWIRDHTVPFMVG